MSLLRKSPIMHDKLATFLFTIYTPLSIVYWLPNLEYIHYLKALFIGVFCFSVLLKGRYDRKALLKSMIFVTFAIIAILPSIFSSSTVTIVDYFQNIFIIGLYFFCSFSLSHLRSDYVIKIVNIICYGILIICLAFLYGVFVGDFDAYLPLDDPYTYFRNTGFNLSRTGWSISLALFTPFFFIERKSATACLMIIPLFFSQIISGGRGGMLATLMCVALILVYRRDLKLLSWSMIILGIAIYINYDFLYSLLRLERLSGSVGGLNRFSAGRLDSYVQSVVILTSHPILGIGYGNLDLTDIVGFQLVHNSVLLIITELGLFSIFLIAPMLFIVFSIRSIGRKYRVPKYIPLLVLFFLMMIEPSVLFRSFQNSFGFWAYLSITNFSDDPISS